MGKEWRGAGGGRVAHTVCTLAFGEDSSPELHSRMHFEGNRRQTSPRLHLRVISDSFLWGFVVYDMCVCFTFLAVVVFHSYWIYGFRNSGFGFLLIACS